MTVTEGLARFLIEYRTSSLPQKVIDLAKRQMLDTLGVALIGSREPAASIVLEYVKSLGGVPEASVLGHRFKSSVDGAALVNGVAAHALDYDDTWVPKGHPSCTVLPVVLGLGEKLCLSGAEVVAAFVMGLEVHGKVGISGKSHATKGYHSTPTLGVLGATAAASRLLRLSVPQTVNALGIGGSLVSGMERNVGTMTKPFHAGHAARSGILAASLAKDGFTADEDIIDGPAGFGNLFLQGWAKDPKAILANLGSPFHIEEPGVGVKLYPSCYMHARPVDAILALRQQHHISYDQVDWVEVVIDPGLIRRSDPGPTTGLRAKFSLEYNAAAAIRYDDITMETFSDEKVHSAEMAEALKKVKLKIDETIPTDYASAYNVVNMSLKDGAFHSLRIDHPVGSWWSPAPTERIVAKYRANAGEVLPAESVERSIQMVLDLEHVQDVAALMGVVSPE